MLRPTIILTTSSNDVSGINLFPTNSPSRKIVIASHIEKISSIRCEMYTNETPSLRNLLITVKSVSISRSVSAAVGSSIIITLAFVINAFAISIICCCPTDNSSANIAPLTCNPNSASCCCAIAFICRVRKIPVFPYINSLPRNIFSATVKFGNMFSS
ncbi:Uncharacterised protein [Streptococcus pneumoniae]|nr:Uncharacterised protein [Streptococcus pneumoniae]